MPGGAAEVGSAVSGSGADVSPAQAEALAKLEKTLTQAFNATIESSIIQADLNTGKQIGQGAAGR
jgi:hypothetical protein